jgi:hypothetical protein
MLDKISTMSSVITLSIFLIVAAGCSNQNSSTGQVAWEEPLNIAKGAGYQGPWRMNDSKFNYVDDPTADFLGGGEIGMAWVEQSDKNIYFQRIAPNNNRRFNQPVNVSQSPEIFSWLPDMHILPKSRTPNDSAHVYLLWQEIVFSGGTHGGEAFFARSTNGGRSFSNPVNLSKSIAGDGKGRLTTRLWHNGSLDLAIGPQGMLYAAWSEYEGKLWMSRSADHGNTFSDPQHVAGNNENAARGPSLAVDSSGTVYLAWTYGNNSNANVMLAISTDIGKSFSNPDIAVSNDGHSDAPSISVGNGQLHLAYALSPSGPFDRYEIRYTQSPLSSIKFKAPRTLGNPQSMKYEMAHFPSIECGSNGQLFIMWELYHNVGGRPEALAFSYSTNNGRKFNSPREIPGSGDPGHGINGSQQGYLLDKLSVNEQGDISVVNSTFQRGRESNIWLFRGNL